MPDALFGRFLESAPRPVNEAWGVPLVDRRRTPRVPKPIVKNLLRSEDAMNVGFVQAKTRDSGGFGNRLQRLLATLKRDADQGAVPGAVLLIAQRGEIVCHEAIGWRDREAGAAMTTDTLFRIYSMTKPVTSVAAMMLMEEGALSLADPVAAYLPEFANVKVAV